MLRYFAGLLLVQLVTVGLFVLNAGAEPLALALGAGLPALAIALLAALWFRTLARADGERDLARLRLEHERERERFHRDAERERLGIVRDAERTLRREERRVARWASVKVGLAFAATAGMGVLFVLSELVTLGLLTLSTGGGALAGYALRWRQTRVVARAGPAAAPAAAPSSTGVLSPDLPAAPTAPPPALPAPAPGDAAGGTGATGSPRPAGRRRRAAPGRARV